MKNNLNYKDNFKTYRDTKVRKNEELIKKAIKYAIEVNSAISFSIISKFTFLIADVKNGEKGIGASTISKNNTYKSLVNEAKYKQRHVENRTSNNYVPIGSQADLKLKIFELLTTNNQLIKELDSYKYIVKNYCNDIDKNSIMENINIKETNSIKQASKGLIQRLLETELVMINDNKELVVSPYGDIKLLGTNSFILIWE